MQAPAGVLPPPALAGPVVNQVQNNQIGDLAYDALKIGALTAVAIGSGIAMTSTLGVVLIGASTVIGGYFAVSHAIDTITSLNPADALVVSARKVEFAFRVVLWTGLIAGALALGLGGASLWGAGSAIYAASNAMEVLFGVQSLLFAVGYTIPFGRWLLLNCNSLDQTVSNGIQAFVQAVQGFQNLNFMGAVRLLAARFLGDGVDIDMLQFLPEDEMKDYFRQNAPLFTKEKIEQLVHKYPNVYTYEFLFGCLSDDQINDLIVPELQKGVEALKDLNIVEEDLGEWDKAIGELTPQYRSDLDADGKAGIYDTVTPMLARLVSHTNSMSALTQLLRKLPPADVQHAEAQALIVQLKGEKDRFAELYDRLIDVKDGSLKKQMIDLVEKTAVKNQDDDLDEESYMTLSALGWRLREFKQFAPTLGLPADGNAMGAVYQALAGRGLATRRDLIQHGILNPKDADDRDVELSRDLIAERLRVFLDNPQPAAVVSEADAVPVPAVDDVPVVAVAAIAPVAVAPAQNQMNDVWRKVAQIANHAFHYISTAALIGIQAYYQAIPTAIGIAIGLTDNAVIARAQLAHVWQTSPDYIDQSLDERSRELWMRVTWTTNSFRMGAIGGVWAGFQHADAIRYYGRPLINYIQQLIA